MCIEAAKITKLPITKFKLPDAVIKLDWRGQAAKSWQQLPAIFFRCHWWNHFSHCQLPLFIATTKSNLKTEKGNFCWQEILWNWQFCIYVNTTQAYFVVLTSTNTTTAISTPATAFSIALKIFQCLAFSSYLLALAQSVDTSRKNDVLVCSYFSAWHSSLLVFDLLTHNTPVLYVNVVKVSSNSKTKTTTTTKTTML